MTDLRDEAIAHLASITRAQEAPSIAGGRYEIHGRIGRGAMGEVWRAKDLALDRVVAVKVGSDSHDSARARRRFEREAKVAARLEHPAVPPIHEVGVLADGRPWYSMRLVPGVTLAAAANDLGSRNDRLRLFLKLCEPVAHAHRLGFVHRDLKPANVMVGPSGAVYVMDWGLARACRESAEPQGETGADSSDEDAARASAAGTPGYMAPEQAAGAPADPRADVHALGGVLVFLLGGDASSPDPSHWRLPDAPRALRAICERARAADANARYPGAAALARDVARFLDRDPVEAHPENLLEKAARAFDRHRFLIWLVGGYLAFRVAIVLSFQ